MCFTLALCGAECLHAFRWCGKYSIAHLLATRRKCFIVTDRITKLVVLATLSSRAGCYPSCATATHCCFIRSFFWTEDHHAILAGS